MAPSVSLVRSVRLDVGRHVVDGFRCGESEIDTWLVRHAVIAERMRTAATYVWVAGGQVVGYYALAPHAVSRDDLPTRVARNSPAMVPAYLIGKLGLTRDWQGRGRGAALLLDACARLASVVASTPARVIVVDALNDTARGFYELHGFRRLGEQPSTLFMTSADLIATVGAAEAIAES